MEKLNFSQALPGFLSESETAARTDGNQHRSAVPQVVDARMASLLDALQEAICILDGSLRVKYWNCAMEQLSGVPRAEALDVVLHRLLPGGLVGPLLEKFERASQKFETLRGELIFRYNEQDHYAFQYKVTPFPYANGTPLVMLSFVDITDQYRLQFEKERQEHFATLSALSVNVAQELAAPLDEICKNVEKVLQELSGLLGSSRLQNSLNSIISQVYRISYLAHNLVALTQQGKPMFVALNMNDTLMDAIDHVEQDEGTRLIANLQFADSLPEVVGDPILMQSAMQILVKIAVEFAGDDAVPRIRTDIDASGQHVMVLFENRGPVLPAEELEHLFEWYYGSTAISPGASLGLFISKKVIEAQKGVFRILSDEARGTVFEIHLPVLAPAAARNGTAPAAS